MSYADGIHFAMKDADLKRGIQHRRERVYTYRPGYQCAACRAKDIEITMPTDDGIQHSKRRGNAIKSEYGPGVAKSARKSR